MVDESGQAGADLMIAVMTGVREYTESYPVEIWRNRTGRLVIRAFNEGGNNCVDLDLWDIINWLSSGSGTGLLGDEKNRRPNGVHA